MSLGNPRWLSAAVTKNSKNMKRTAECIWANILSEVSFHEAIKNFSQIEQLKWLPSVVTKNSENMK